jgi:2-oxoglutarate ferredoxin oxidoreductase subunit gamma
MMETQVRGERADHGHERALIVTGVGGQGIQLVAKTLALAYTRLGRHAMLGAAYGGEMRGGPSQATVVVGDAPLRSLPIVPKADAVMFFHERFSDHSRERLAPEGSCLLNTSVVGEDFLADHPRRFAIPATQTAKDLGATQAAGFVMLGAYAALLDAPPLDLLVEAMRELLPPYRQQHADTNARALRAGAELAQDVDRVVA